MTLHMKIAQIGQQLQDEANRRAGPRGRHVEDRGKLLVQLAENVRQLENRLAAALEKGGF